MKTKFFLYARKSTEDEERQVMSIEAQLAELAEFAKRENIEIAETFIESKSTKKPHQEIFNEMMSKVHESKEPIGLIAWHPFMPNPLVNNPFSAFLFMAKRPLFFKE